MMRVGSVGNLYVVAGPIGNLEDITLRALRILKGASRIFAEDTRHTRKLLAHYAISVPCERYSDHFNPSKKQAILSHCKAGHDIVLISDAGTPVISDPGWSLVDLAWREGVRVVPVPGPSAPIAALSVCGFPLSHFVFWGWVPRTPLKRTRALESVKEWQCVVFLESPHRLLSTLDAICALELPGLQVYIARELSKQFEELVRGTPDAVAGHFKERGVKGELCIILYYNDKGGLHGQG